MRFIVLLGLLFIAPGVYADDQEDEYNTEPFDSSIFEGEKSVLDIKFGFSPFLGGMALEWQKNHYAVGIGIPGNIAFKNYEVPYQNSKFFTIYGGHFPIEYRENGWENRPNAPNITYYGLGGGYRWQEKNGGWNLSANIGVHYIAYPYWLKGGEISPGVIFGYAF